MRFILYLLFIFFNLLNYYEECGKKEPSAERGRTHLDLFFYGAAYMCFFFFLRRAAHTRDEERISVAQTARMGIFSLTSS